ncbi:DEAD/DEAH box helicase [Methylomagnum sp.]
MAFSSLGLDQALLRAIDESGYTVPTPIQSQSIPAILAGRDLLAAAQTGTGKTAAFTLPLLQRLSDDARVSSRPMSGRAPRALVLVPTRELAAQVSDSIKKYGKHTSIRSAVIFGGVGMNPQIDTLRRGVDILIATPGRLLDLVGQGVAKLGAVEFLVLDEADRMLDMGFIPDIKRILALLPKVRQNLLFSATFAPEIRTLAAGMLRNPLSVEVAPRNAPAESVEQRVYHVRREAKQTVLAQLIRDGNWGQTLVFTRTKHGANRLAQQMERDGFQVAVIHGNKSQNARTRALSDFKEDRVQVLVATDIAARGLDIRELPHVVNYELPDVPADYVHRIGRTGRAGAVGEAVSLVSSEESIQLRDIERLLGRKLPAQKAEGDLGPLPKQEPAAPSRSHPSRAAPSRPELRRGSRQSHTGARRRAF